MFYVISMVTYFFQLLAVYCNALGEARLMVGAMSEGVGG